MWCDTFTSGSFRACAAQSYIWNIVFGVGINAAVDFGKADIEFITDFTDDMASAFFYQAFFCGLFTPPFSSYAISESVAAGAICPPDADAIAKSWFGWVLRRGNCTRSLLLALVSCLLFGLPTVGVGAFVCKHRSWCQLRIWVFLVILTVWSIPLQIVVSLLNYVSTAHMSRDRCCPLSAALLKDAGDTIHHPSEGSAGRVNFDSGCLSKITVEGAARRAELCSSLLPNNVEEAKHCPSEERVRCAALGGILFRCAFQDV